GRLGDCWLVAVMAACELTQPGFLRRLIADGRTASSDAPVGAGRGPASGSAAGLVAVDLFSPALAVAGLRRLPLLPVRRRRTLVSTRVPVRHRRSEEHTSELQSRFDLVCRLLLEKTNFYGHR